MQIDHHIQMVGALLLKQIRPMAVVRYYRIDLATRSFQQETAAVRVKAIHLTEMMVMMIVMNPHHLTDI